MSNPNSDTEVYFHQYCSNCIYKDVNEQDDPCDECLTYPVNENSHKPVNYKEDKENERKTKARRSPDASS